MAKAVKVYGIETHGDGEVRLDCGPAGFISIKRQSDRYSSAHWSAIRYDLGVNPAIHRVEVSELPKRDANGLSSGIAF